MWHTTAHYKFVMYYLFQKIANRFRLHSYGDYRVQFAI